LLPVKATGKTPALAPVGMMGDRVDVIFANPDEIAQFIKPKGEYSVGLRMMKPPTHTSRCIVALHAPEADGERHERQPNLKFLR
jgi:hypothetical protein